MEGTFGERLRMIRKRQGMKQSDLAEALGVTVQTVVRYEKLAREQIRSDRVKEIASVLHVDVSELTGLPEDGGEGEIQHLIQELRKVPEPQREAIIKVIMYMIKLSQAAENSLDKMDQSV